jgi:hypothetical protein
MHVVVGGGEARGMTLGGGAYWGGMRGVLEMGVGDGIVVFFMFVGRYGYVQCVI